MAFASHLYSISAPSAQFNAQSQPLTYMKLAEVKIGLLLNFNVTKLKDGIHRFVL